MHSDYKEFWQFLTKFHCKIHNIFPSKLPFLKLFSLRPESQTHPDPLTTYLTTIPCAITPWIPGVPHSECLTMTVLLNILIPLSFLLNYAKLIKENSENPPLSEIFTLKLSFPSIFIKDYRNYPCIHDKLLRDPMAEALQWVLPI